MRLIVSQSSCRGIMVMGGGCTKALHTGLRDPTSFLFPWHSEPCVMIMKEGEKKLQLKAA